LSSDIKLYSYNKNKKKIVSYSEFGGKESNFPLSGKELAPFDELKVSAVGVPAKKYIAAYVINLVFHRESDLKRFILQKYFFTENKIIYTNDKFAKSEHYADVMGKIRLFDPTKIKTIEVHFTPADDHTWFVESDAMHKIRKEKNGRLRIIGDPVSQGEEPMEGFPHLVITPHKFSKCDCFISAKIVGEYVEAKIQHRISNFGDADAGITENGFDIIKEIEPGKDSYHVSYPYKLESDEVSQLSAQEIYEKLMSGEDKIRAGVTIMYRPANDPGRLFSVSTMSEFTPNTVKSIEKENYE
jgi:hypothetical protein